MDYLTTQFWEHISEKKKKKKKEKKVGGKQTDRQTDRQMLSLFFQVKLGAGLAS